MEDEEDEVRDWDLMDIPPGEVAGPFPGDPAGGFKVLKSLNGRFVDVVGRMLIGSAGGSPLNENWDGGTTTVGRRARPLTRGGSPLNDKGAL